MSEPSKLAKENAVLRRALSGRAEMEEMFGRYGDGVVRKSILAGLRGTTADNSVWQAVHAALRFSIRDAKDALLAPGLTSEELHRYAGAMSVLEEFQALLFRLRAEADQVDEAS